MSRLFIPYGVTHIPSWAFRNDLDIEEAVMPPTVLSIGEGAFAHCKNLKRVTFPSNLIAIGRQAFKECGIEAVSFPSSLRVVEAEAFASCHFLKSIENFLSVTEWGDGALSDVDMTGNTYVDFLMDVGERPLLPYPSPNQRKDYPWAAEHSEAECVIPRGRNRFDIGAVLYPVPF